MSTTSNGLAGAYTAGSSVVRRCRARLLTGRAGAAVVVAVNAKPGTAAAAPVVGDTYVYRVVNGYSKEPRGEISCRVDKIEADRVFVSVSTENPTLKSTPTEIYAVDGNWLRHSLTNHDQPRDYEFAPAYPAYAFPLESGKSWSLRVEATDPVSGRRNSVRVDGKVLGRERIRVPAGEFDTIKVRRLVYAGDWDGFLRETNITETEWYAPALGRPVRIESKSEWLDISRCGRECPWFRGDWNISELVAAPGLAR